MKWASVCKHKKEVGLGFRTLCQMNQAPFGEVVVEDWGEGRWGWGLEPFVRGESSSLGEVVVEDWGRWR